MDGDEILLTADQVSFYSEHDEAAFFEWLGKLGCPYRGSGRSVQITVKAGEVSDELLRDLLALFYRYKIEMKQLAVFRDDVHRAWFASRMAYWFDKVF